MLPRRLFRTHVLQGSDGEPRSGQALSARFGHGEGDAEVGQERLPVLQEYVPGLDVAMDHTLPMGEVERSGDLSDDPDGLVDGEQPLAGQPVPQGLAAHERHDVEEGAVGGPRIVQRKDVRVLQVRGDLDLLQKALRSDRRRQVGLEHLQRDVPVVPDVAGQVDGGHATLAELPLDEVAVGQCGPQLLERGGVLAHAHPVEVGGIKDTLPRGAPPCPSTRRWQGAHLHPYNGRMTRVGRRVFLGLSIVCALSARTGLSAQTVYGVLLERDTDRPIDLGLVTLLTVDGDSVDSVLSDAAGEFRLEASGPGDFRLAASALGYKPTIAASVLSLPKGSSMTLQFRIEPLPIEIGGITIEARSSLFKEPNLVRNGFVDRLQRGFGRFITPVDVDRSPASSTSDLLARTGRVTTRYVLGGDRILMMGTRGYCSPTVYVDGFRVDLSDISIDVIAPKLDLEAAEVYRSAAEAPLRFGGGMEGCGVIVLWTRLR